MMPNGWKSYKFSDLLVTGDIEKIQDGNHGNSHPKSRDFIKSGIPFVMARDLKGGTVDLNSCAYISKKQADSLRIGFAKTGDILLSHKGTIGLVAIVPPYPDYMMLTPQVTCYRIPKKSKILKNYLYQFFLSYEYQTRLESLASQSTRSYLGITAQKQLSIPLPPLTEQQKIAQILTTWDKAITTIERLIDSKTQLKKALMQQLLMGEKRLLDEYGRKFEYKWQWVKLESVCDVKGGKRLPKGSALSVDKTPHPYIRVADMYMGGVDISNIKYVPKEIAPLISRYTISKNDLFITVAGTLGIIGEIPKVLNGANLTENADKLTNITCDKKFLLYVMSSSIIQRYIDAVATQNAQPKLALSKIREFKVPLPTLEEQQKIAKVLTNADDEINLLTQQLNNLKLEKKALMQQLLTGKIRVNV